MKVFFRVPTQVLAYLPDIHCVSTIMSRTVGDIAAKLVMGGMAGIRLRERSRYPDLFNDLDIRRLVVPSDIVGFRQGGLAATTCQMASQWSIDIEPISDLHSISIDGQRAAIQGVQDHQWYKFSGNWNGP